MSTEPGQLHLYFLIFAKLAYDASVFGAFVSKFLQAGFWAIGVLIATLTLLGVAGVAKESLRNLFIAVINFRLGRALAVGCFLLFGTICLVGLAVAKPPPTWSCKILGRLAGPSDPSRCRSGSAVRRSFVLELKRISAPSNVPTLQVSVKDASRSASIDSDVDRLCAGSGPDTPGFGKGQLVLSRYCGLDAAYKVNVNLCDSKESPTTTNHAAELRAAATLEVFDGDTGDNGQTIECK